MSRKAGAYSAKESKDDFEALSDKLAADLRGHIRLLVSYVRLNLFIWINIHSFREIILYIPRSGVKWLLRVVELRRYQTWNQSCLRIKKKVLHYGKPKNKHFGKLFLKISLHFLIFTTGP